MVMRCKHLTTATLFGFVAATSVPAPGEAPKPDHSRVPGVVIDHSPAASGRYIGSPSITILPDGTREIVRQIRAHALKTSEGG